jgi:hypothetical protein
MLTKICNSCKDEKPAILEEFRKNPGGRQGMRSTCRTCENTYNRKQAKINKDRWMPAKRSAELKRKYGITLDVYNSMLAIQDGKCKLCGSDSPRAHNNKNFSVDHCHKTLKVRGLLCSPCNTLVGYLESTNNLNLLLGNLPNYLS